MPDIFWMITTRAERENKAANLRAEAAALEAVPDKPTFEQLEERFKVLYSISDYEERWNEAACALARYINDDRVYELLKDL